MIVVDQERARRQEDKEGVKRWEVATMEVGVAVPLEDLPMLIQQEKAKVQSNHSMLRNLVRVKLEIVLLKQMLAATIVALAEVVHSVPAAVTVTGQQLSSTVPAERLRMEWLLSRCQRLLVLTMQWMLALSLAITPLAMLTIHLAGIDSMYWSIK